MVTKKGRPASNNPKGYMLRVRLDKETLFQLDQCCKTGNTSRSEVVRKGIQEQYDRLENHPQAHSACAESSLTFARIYDIILYGKIGGEEVSPRTGRPTGNKKTERLEIRMTPDEARLLQECAEELGLTKTEVLMKGIQLVKMMLDGREEELSNRKS